MADLLRGDFKQSQYGRIILPFTLLRRLECVLEPSKDAVLEPSKDAVLAEFDKLADKEYPDDAKEKLLLKVKSTCVRLFVPRLTPRT